MKVYVAMICDRHTDPEPFVFTNPVTAMQFARAQAEENMREHAEIDESDTPDGWLYYATYSEEGDSVWVIEKTLDEH